jgi:hypothetical protein
MGEPVLRNNRVVVATVLAAVVLTPLSLTSANAAAPMPAKGKVFKNCTALNKAYPHGVALKKGVKDKTKGKAVRTYKVNTLVYKANKRLDRDKDGIACEKR